MPTSKLVNPGLLIVNIIELLIILLVRGRLIGPNRPL